MKSTVLLAISALFCKRQLCGHGYIFYGVTIEIGVGEITPVVDCVVSKSRPSCYGYAFTAVVHSGESDWPAGADVVVRNCHRGPLFVAA